MKKSFVSIIIVALFVAIMVTGCNAANGVGEIKANETETAFVCQYLDGYTAEGKVYGAGTRVTGPALVKPDRNKSFAYGIPVDVVYTTKATDEVVWLLRGDNVCVQSQHMFFEKFEMYSENTVQNNKVCKYADGQDQNGTIVPAGTTVNAPALIQESGKIYALKSGSYTTVANATIWKFNPNITDNCLKEQLQYFGGFTPVEIG